MSFTRNCRSSSSLCLIITRVSPSIIKHRGKLFFNEFVLMQYWIHLHDFQLAQFFYLFKRVSINTVLFFEYIFNLISKIFFFSYSILNKKKYICWKCLASYKVVLLNCFFSMLLIQRMCLSERNVYTAGFLGSPHSFDPETTPTMFFLQSRGPPESP